MTPGQKGDSQEPGIIDHPVDGLKVAVLMTGFIKLSCPMLKTEQVELL